VEPRDTSGEAGEEVTLQGLADGSPLPPPTNKPSYCLDEPLWRVEPRDTSGEAGEEVTLQGLADGSPAPSYAWYRHPDFNNVSTVGSHVC
jgi:hypothetical protein